MLYWAAVFFIVALIAAVLGFGGIAAGAASIAKILFFIFLIAFGCRCCWASSAERRKRHKGFAMLTQSAAAVAAAFLAACGSDPTTLSALRLAARMRAAVSSYAGFAAWSASASCAAVALDGCRRSGR